VWWVEKTAQLLVLWAALLACFFSEKEVKVILVTSGGFPTSLINPKLKLSNLANHRTSSYYNAMNQSQSEAQSRQPASSAGKMSVS